MDALLIVSHALLRRKSSGKRLIQFNLAVVVDVLLGVGIDYRYRVPFIDLPYIRHTLEKDGTDNCTGVQRSVETV
jgi:hypothetical protein